LFTFLFIVKQFLTFEWAKNRAGKKNTQQNEHKESKNGGWDKCKATSEEGRKVKKVGWRTTEISNSNAGQSKQQIVSLVQGH